jgi:hypothetical protein
MRKITLAAALMLALGLTSQMAFAEESCEGSGTQLTKEQVEAKLKAAGYVEIKEIQLHSGCYEAKGLDKDGKRFELEINSYTGKIAQAE